jgi:uncharacterized membrane protein YfcA
MHYELWQWAIGAGAAAFIGVSKTGVPGVGILVVPMLAYAFGGRPSVGIMLPMLIFADCFAVAWYRRHAQWDKLIKLLPWVVAGMVLGSTALWIVGEINTSKDILGIIIGILVLRCWSFICCRDGWEISSLLHRRREWLPLGLPRDSLQPFPTLRDR